MFNLGSQELLLIVIVFLPPVYCLIQLKHALEDIEPLNRKMKPQNVWFTLIPLFGIIYVFFVINAVADSLEAQGEKYGVLNKGKSTLLLGALWAISIALMPFLMIFMFLPLIITSILYSMVVNRVKRDLLAVKKSSENNEMKSILFS